MAEKFRIITVNGKKRIFCGWTDDEIKAEIVECLQGGENTHQGIKDFIVKKEIDCSDKRLRTLEKIMAIENKVEIKISHRRLFKLNLKQD